MVKKGWIPTDERIQHMQEHQWMMYFYILKKQEAIDMNRQRMMFELVGAIANPHVFDEYRKHMYDVEDTEKSALVTVNENGFLDVYKDQETGIEVPFSDIENMINNTTFNRAG